MLILDLWGISFHAVVVFGLGKNLLFKSILGRCGLRRRGRLSHSLDRVLKLVVKKGEHIVENKYVGTFSQNNINLT